MPQGVEHHGLHRHCWHEGAVRAGANQPCRPAPRRLCGHTDMGQAGVGMPEPHQGGALAPLIGDRPVLHTLPGWLYKVVGKIQPRDRRGTWRDTHPFVCTRLVPIQSPRSLPERRGQPYN